MNPRVFRSKIMVPMTSTQRNSIFILYLQFPTFLFTLYNTLEAQNNLKVFETRLLQR